MATMLIVSSTYSNITAGVSGLDGSFAYGRTFQWYVNGTLSGTSYASAGATSKVYTYTGLSPSTTYSLSVDISRTDNGEHLASLSVSGATDPLSTTASFTVTGQTASTISISVSVDNHFSQYRFFWRKSSESNANVTSWTTHNSNFTYTFTGLDANTTYVINVGYGDGSLSGTIGSQTVTTSAAGPSLWSWTSSNGSASAAQTSAAYTAVTTQGKITNFSYLVWNDMVDKVNDVLSYAGYSWDNTYATYNNTKMGASSKEMTAVRFNSLRNNIGIHYSTGISAVSRGDKIYGSYFTTLMTKVNAWINSL